MMNYYYYPLCSKEFTFENIFASESISPPAFYKKRGFGMDFFFKIPSVHHESAIILYNQPPKYSTGENEKDIVKFILRVKESCLDINGIISIAEGVIGYQKTIYLNTDGAGILFFSERDKTLLCLKTESSLPTKSVNKYVNNFFVIDDKECVDFGAPDLTKLELKAPFQDKEISYDRIYNSFKGFCYGVACGLLNDQSKEQILLKVKLQEITNSFGEFKNRVLNDAKGSALRYNRKENSTISVESLQKTLFLVIQEAEKLFQEMFAEDAFSDEKLEKYLLKKFGNYFSSPEEMQLYLRFKKLDDEIFGTSNFSKLKSKYLSDNLRANPSFHFEILKEQVKSFSSGLRYSNEWANSIKEKSNEVFKDSLFELTRFIDAKFLDKGKARKIDLNGIGFDFESLQILIEPGFLGLDRSISDEFSTVINLIFRHAKFGKGEVKKELLLKVVEEIGTALSKNRSGKDTQLYRYLDNQVNSYALDKAHSTVMKNFVAFIFNTESLEKLEKYLIAKNIEDKWIAYAIWCTFNGFSNTSKFFVAPFFDSERKELTDYMDKILSKTFLHPEHPQVSSEKLPDFNKDVKNQEPANNQTERVRDFYMKSIEGRFKLSLEQFIFITTFEKKTKIATELKSKFRIAKKDADKIADSYIEYIKTPSLF